MDASVLRTIIYCEPLNRVIFRNDVTSHGIKVALFRSQKDPDVFAYTSVETGETLPSRFAPWGIISVWRGASPDNPETKIGARLTQALREDGFCLVCSRSTHERLGLEMSVIGVRTTAGWKLPRPTPAQKKTGLTILH
jgi:hypothetical protein